MLEKYSTKYLNESVELFYSVFRSETFNFFWLEKLKVIEYFQDLYNTPKFLGFIYKKDDQVIGVCLGVINDYFGISSYEIKEILIKLGEQKKGYGNAFLNDIEKYLINEDITAVSLATSRDIDAFKFYVKNGYEVADTSVFLSKHLCKN